MAPLNQETLWGAKGLSHFFLLLKKLKPKENLKEV